MRPSRRRSLAVATVAIILVAGIALWRARLRLAEALVMRAVASAGVVGAELAVTEMGPRGALLERVRLGDSEQADLEIERIAVRYTLLGMLRRHLGEVEVTGLRLRGRADASGVSFGKLDALLEGPREPDTSAGALWLPPVDALKVQDARVELAAAGEMGALTAEGIEGELAVADGKPRGRLTVGAIRSERLPPVALTLRLSPGGAGEGAAGEIPLALELSAAEGRAQLAGEGSLRVDPPAARLALAGTIELAPGTLQPADLAPQVAAFVASAKGKLSIRTELRTGSEGFALAGRVETDGLDLVTPGGIAVQGITGGADFAGPAPLRTSGVQTLRFRSADVIGPFEDGEVRFALRGSELEVPEATWSYAGGRLSTSGRFDLAAKEQPFTVQVADVSLEQLLALIAVPELSGSGSLSGSLPLVYDGERLRVSEGRLAAAPPGGVVRYAPATARAGSLGLGGDVDVLTGALEDFHYDTLRIDVSGALDGDVQVGVALHGQNPRYEGGRRVELNVNVETNLPALLRGARSVTNVPEVIERRLRDRVPPDDR